MAEYLLEIGLEEMPAGPIPNVIKELEHNTKALLERERIQYGDIKCYATPRRLVLMISKLNEMQDDLLEEVKGPSLKAAYKDGEIAKPLLGFLKANNFTETDVYTKTLPNGEYIFCKKEAKGIESKKVLETIIPELILSLKFPKTMKWGNHDLRYIRPIRWLVSLLDASIVDFSVGSVKSGNISRGHRTLGHEIVEIPNANAYLKTMEDEFVIVDQDKRKSMILNQIEDLFNGTDEYYQEDQSLLNEIIYLVEYPTVLKGVFDEKFMALPNELIITPMKEHQRYFPVLKKNGELVNAFVTVRNGNREHLDIVTAGNLNVLRARLADAEFFYEEDLKKGLESGTEKIKNIIFQEKLGTIYDKTLRLKDIVKALSINLDFNASVQEDSITAAQYMKLDLVSNVVSEFPELQGIMGEYYFNAQYPNKSNIGQAIREHYQPRFANDELPQTVEGSLVSIADKFDTLVGCYYAGIIPTGSKDPYALRRQALGIVNIIISNKWSLSLKDCIELVCSAYQNNNLDFNSEATNEKIYQFFEQRLLTILKDMGFSADIIQSVLKAGYEKPYETILRAEALKAFIDENEHLLIKRTFDNLGRAINIAEKASESSIQEDLLENQYEKDFLEALKLSEKHIQSALETNSFHALFDVVLKVNDKVEAFFDNVLVMDENKNIRENRLALVKQYANLLHKYYRLDECKVV